jgi:hypothetical protein
VYTATVEGANDGDQTGIRVDLHQSDRSQFFSRYSWFTGYNINPVSVRGTDLPGYPTRDDFTANSFVVPHTALPSSSMTNSFEFSFFRYEFLFDQRLNKTPPSALGFNFDSASQIGQGPPFFNLAGYSPVGGAITGPRTSAQNTYEIHDGLSLLRSKYFQKSRVSKEWQIWDGCCRASLSGGGCSVIWYFYSTLVRSWISVHLEMGFGSVSDSRNLLVRGIGLPAVTTGSRASPSSAAA